MSLAPLFIAAALGIFDGQSDIGKPALAGGASVDGAAYTLRGAGANMIGARDEFHFVWRKLRGDFALSARVLFTGPGRQAHRKAGLMARAGLGDAAAFVGATVHGDGPEALQVRRGDGGQAALLVLAPPPVDAGARLVRLERHGSRFTVAIQEAGKPEVRRDLSDARLPDTLYVGLFLCAHDAGVVETARFDQVSLATGIPTTTTGDTP